MTSSMTAGGTEPGSAAPLAARPVPTHRRSRFHRARRHAVGALVILCVFLAALTVSVTAPSATQAAQTVEFNLTTGEAIKLPSIDTVNCADVLTLLMIIDSTGYREFTPEPPTHPNDFLLYQYEWELARMAREDCPGGLRAPVIDESDE